LKILFLKNIKKKKRLLFLATSLRFVRWICRCLHTCNMQNFLFVHAKSNVEDAILVSCHVHAQLACNMQNYFLSYGMFIFIMQTAICKKVKIFFLLIYFNFLSIISVSVFIFTFILPMDNILGMYFIFLFPSLLFLFYFIFLSYFIIFFVFFLFFSIFFYYCSFILSF